MKAKFLKLAGVKDENAFYKKFPTEEAFMAKYGKQLKKLKKAKVGDMIAGDISAPDTNQPLFYNDLTSNAEALVTGVSSQEKQRREALSSQQAIADASAKSNQGGLGDILGKISPEMIASAFGKNGKKLKKAFGGADVPADALDYMSNGSMPSDYQATDLSNIGQNAFGGIKSFTGGDLNLDSVKGFDWKGLAGKVAPGIGPVIGAIEQYGQQKKDLAKTKQYGAVSDVVLQANSSIPELSQRRYVRPEDSKVSAMNPLGSRTNYLAARNGAEIQNTYAPDVMYTDLGYEPLNDSNVKQYRKGGKMRRAEGGVNLDPFAGIAGGIGGVLGSKAGKGSGKGGPGSTIGSTIGGIAGSFIPIPGVGTALGSLAGGFIGGLFDAEDQNAQQAAQDKLDQNMQGLAFQQGAKNIQQTNKGFMKEGGWVSHDWQPQVIASFGEHSMKDLLAPDPMMDTLRAGGHLKQYTPPSARAMYTGRDLPYQMEDGGQMAMDGDLQVYRGSAETLSYNPFLPNGGETVMFKGPSHDDGGMPVSYGNNGVEVEGGEPAMVMKDGGQKDNLLVFGNLLDPMNNRKFKNVAADISKKEAKQNKTIDKATALSNNADENNTFGQIELNSAFASDLGAKMNLKKYAMEKEDLAHRQNAILDTAEEFGIKPENIEYAKFGGKFDASESFAKGGKKGKVASPFTKKGQAALKSKTLIPSTVFAPKGNTFLDQVEKESDQAMGLNRYYPSGLEKPMSEQTYTNPKEINTSSTFREALSPEARGIGSNVYENFDPYKGEAKKEAKSNDDLSNILRSAYSSIYPFIRPTAGQPLDPNQLNPEYLASAMNQQEPVQAQLYNPMLTQATSISLQDQLNEVTAQTRDAMRMAQGDPSALAMIASQAEQAKSKILGEQFRMNQGERQRVADQNINTLNDAQLKNLALLDQQYVRQETGKSKTKEQSIAIAKSIAEKYAQNKAENRKVKVMENMYPAFSFTQDGTAYKNPAYLTGFGPGMGGGSSETSISGAMTVGGKKFLPTNYDKQGNPTNYKVIGSEDESKKNGGIVKAFKNF